MPEDARSASRLWGSPFRGNVAAWGNGYVQKEWRKEPVQVSDLAAEVGQNKPCRLTLSLRTSTLMKAVLP
jgi:hypothetical protein